MGLARLLAKGWVVFCCFATAHAIARAWTSETPAAMSVLQATIIPGCLFCAMGLLFIGGYAVSSGHITLRFRPASFLPGFNEIVALAFLVLIFLVQTVASPIPEQISAALRSAIGFAVPGQHALEVALARCSVDSTVLFCAAAAWLLAFVYLGSAVTRLRISAALLQLEGKRHPEPLGPSGIALILGIAAIAGIQFLFVGSLFRLLPCKVLSGILGDVLVGAAPVMLGYLAAAALANLLAAHDG
jgi:hypothetical protein